MHELSNFDHRLISALRLDGRASVTTLAATLSVSRATVQTHMEKLVASGVIKRFTVEVDTISTRDLIRAVMMIELQGNLARAVTNALRNKPEIVSLHSTNGAWDLIAHIETPDLAEFDRVLREIREISGVLNSETCILLNNALA